MNFKRINDLIMSTGIKPEDEHFDIARVIIQECLEECRSRSASYEADRKNARDYEEKQIYNEGAAASQSIMFAIMRKFGVK